MQSLVVHEADLYRGLQNFTEEKGPKRSDLAIDTKILSMYVNVYFPFFEQEIIIIARIKLNSSPC